MNNSFVIRSLKPDDASDVKQLALKSWLFTYKDIFSDDEIKEFNNNAYSEKSLKWIAQHIENKQIDKYTQFLVVETIDSSRIVGFSQVGVNNYWEYLSDDFDPESYSIQLLRIYLHPDYIGRGLGSELLKNIENFIKSIGRLSYGVFVHKKNQIGKKFYEKSGFEYVPSRDKDDELYLVKQLNHDF